MGRMRLESQSAANLLQSMDPSADPCDNFYQFVCGRWGKEHPTPESAVSNDWFNERNNLMIREIREFLKKNSSSSEPLPVTQARLLYNSCVDTDTLDKLGLDPMFEVLDQIGLPRRPPVKESSPGFNIMKVSAKAKLLVAKDLLVGFGVYPDSHNKSVNRLTVGSPDPNSPLPSYHDLERRIDRNRRRSSYTAEEKESPGVVAFVQYIYDVMKYAHQWGTSDADSLEPEMHDLFKSAAMTIAEFEHELYKMVGAIEYIGMKPLEMTVEELQQLTDIGAGGVNYTTQFKWHEFLTYLYEDIDNVTLDLSGEDRIVVLEGEYFQNLSALLVNTTKETLELVMWWDIVRILAPTTNKDMRRFKETYIEKVTGGRAPQTRSTFCTNAVNQMMGMAVSYFIADPKFLNTTKQKVEEMLSDIQWAFGTLVNSLDWMDATTKRATLEKSDAVKSFIGFPEWLLDSSELELYYSGVRKQLCAVFVSVPSGILQYPFYGLGLEAMNYGAIGAILGHELTHGFDNEGRQFDKDGNMRQWWSNNTVEEYENRSQCFIDLYSSYRVEEVDTYVNGRLTLGENIADNGGVREAFRAYKRYLNRNGHEPMLPGLEKYSHEQLFFMSFTNVWCESWSETSLRWALEDEHAPNHIRVSGVLSNSEDFSDTWRCPVGSNMNPIRNRCRLCSQFGIVFTSVGPMALLVARLSTTMTALGHRHGIHQTLSLTRVSHRSLGQVESLGTGECRSQFSVLTALSPILVRKDSSFPNERSHFNLEVVSPVYTLSVSSV
uniref:Uncharacterized protein n=1 Tax=Timema monikensis TaxID=170555 RepID=A0A7R9HHH5_9NEOP|nr:unnamed protein product [Timema monikensis]